MFDFKSGPESPFLPYGLFRGEAQTPLLFCSYRGFPEKQLNHALLILHTMPMFTGPPPIPLRARNKETEAQLENARVAFRVSWRSILAIIVLFLAFLAFLYVLQG